MYDGNLIGPVVPDVTVCMMEIPSARSFRMLPIEVESFGIGRHFYRLNLSGLSADDVARWVCDV
jgi:hypothetical protein